jgi:hypothetical protein
VAGVDERHVSREHWGMMLSFLYKYSYSIYLFNVSHTQQRYRVFLQATNSALVTNHHQALSKNRTLKLQFRMDTLHYFTNGYSTLLYSWICYVTLQMGTLHYFTNG